MGNVFSREEKKEIAPHFEGINPVSLAVVIWDCINEEGMDNRDKEVGISFDGDGSEAGKNNITFWDNGETTSLPKNVFLEIMKMTGEQVVKIFEDNYDLQRSKELLESVSVLKAALEHLEQHMSTVESKISAEEYRRLIDSETEPEEIEWDDEAPVAAVDIQVPVLTLPTDDTNADDSDSSDEAATPPPDYLLQRRRSTRGIEGVMDRLPELRRRCDAADEPEMPMSPASPLAFDKVRKKVKLLSMFHVKKDEVSPEETTADKLPNSQPGDDDDAKLKPDNTRGDAARAAEKPRASSVDNFFKNHHPAKHQFSTASLPGDLSSLAAKKQSSMVIAPTSPSITPVPSLPGSVEDIPSERTTPTSLRNLHLGFLTPFGSLDASTHTPTPPESLSPTPPGGTGSKVPGDPGSAPRTPSGSASTNSPTPPDSVGNKLLGSKPPGSTSSTPTGSRNKNLSTPSSSLDTNSPTPPPGAEANRSHLAWAGSLDSSSSGTPPVSMGPHNFPSPEGTDISTLPLPGSVEISSPPASHY